MRRSFAMISAAALFCAGGACGWLMRGDGKGTGLSPVPSAKTVDAPAAPNGRDVRSPDKGRVAEPQFTEAVSATEFRRQQGPAQTATVEEVKDEDGLTADERVEKFRREHPDEWEALQRRRAARHAARQAEAAKKQDFIASVTPDFLTPEQWRVHAAFAAALEARQTLRERIRVARADGGAASPEDMVALRRAERTLREQADAERTALFEAAARSVGVEAANAADFAAILKEIVSVTEDQQKSHTIELSQEDRVMPNR